jgi:DNA-binding CsgD family transcriptional regulator
MVHADALGQVAGDFLSAALMDDEWEAALARFSAAIGARGAVLMRCRGHRLVSDISTEGVRQHITDFLAGRAPPNSRQVRASRNYTDGFRFDYDDYSAEDLARDPYYQEFLRPNGFFWHANVRLDGDQDEEIALSLKRDIRRGSYEEADRGALNAILPGLRAAARVARSMLDGEAAGMVRLLQHRGSSIFELDSWGRVLRTHSFDEDADCPVRVRARKLLACDRIAQPGLDRAIAAGAATPGTPAVAVLTDDSGETCFMQLVPVGGRARDVFRAAAAVAVLIRRPKQPRLPVNYAATRAAFGLTDREAEVTHLLGEGLSVIDIARRIRVKVDTVRDHLKSAFDKTGTSRQAELVALLARLTP